MRAKRGQEFVFCNGATAKSVKQLVERIKNLSPDEFDFHVNHQRNDFYNWMNDCVDDEFAKEISGNLAQRDLVEKLTGHHWHHEHKKKFNY